MSKRTAPDRTAAARKSITAGHDVTTQRFIQAALYGQALEFILADIEQFKATPPLSRSLVGLIASIEATVQRTLAMGGTR